MIENSCAASGHRRGTRACSGCVTRLKLRPHFDLQVRLSPQEARERLERFFSQEPPVFEAHLTGPHVQISVPADRRTLLSPWLTFEIKPHSDGSLLTGRFASNPSFFTLYAASLAVVIFMTIGLAFAGLAQWMAGSAPTALWAVPVGTILGLLLFGVAYFGQRFTGPDMQAMRGFVTGALGDAEPVWLECAPAVDSDASR